MTSHNNFGKMQKALNKVQSTIRDVKKATLFVLFFHWFLNNNGWICPWKKKQLFVNIYCSANTLEIIFNKDL